MATVRETEQTQETECMQQIRKELHHVKRKFEGMKKLHRKQINDYNKLLRANTDLRCTLDSTSRKSKGRRRAIRGLEQALRMERLRHGYIKTEDMTYDERDAMLFDIAKHKAEFERQQREAKERQERDSE